MKTFDSIKTLVAAFAVFAGFYTATAERWLNPDVSSSDSHLIFFTIKTFRVEIIIVLLILLLAALPTKLHKRVQKTFRTSLRHFRDIIRAIARKRVSALHIQAISLSICAFTSIVTLFAITSSSIFYWAKAHTRIAIHADREFLRYLCEEADKKLLRGDLTGAEKTYSTIIKFFGSRSAIDPIKSQLSAIKAYDIYSSVWAKRATEIERDQGPNPRSLFMLAEAFRFSPRIGEVSTRISSYIDVLTITSTISKAVDEACEGGSSAKVNLPMLSDAELQKIRAFFTTSVAASAYRSASTASSSDAKTLSVMNLCNYRSAFGAILFDYGDAGEALTSQVDRVRQGDGILGVSRRRD
jgi:hypothetical protein